MLEQARAKARKRGADIRFIMRDAENTMEPGGKLLIVDCNMGKKTWVGKPSAALGKLTGRAPRAHMTPQMQERPRSIRSRVYFADQMPAEAVVKLLTEVGFVNPVVDRQLADIHWAQARKMPPLRALERMVQDDFAICVTKPD